MEKRIVDTKKSIHVAGRLTFLIIMLGLLSACSKDVFYSGAAGMVDGYAEDVATPALLRRTDVNASCAFGMSNALIFRGFNDLADVSDKTLSLLDLLSANCSEHSAQEAELRYLRALKSNALYEAKDARTEQKQWLKLTATRRLQSFYYGMNAFNYPWQSSNAVCPVFNRQQDEMTFLLSLLTGLQAVLADAGAETMAGVPRSIAPAVARATRCLDNPRWGGSPAAIEASVWLLLPDLKDKKSPDTWEQLERNARAGQTFGVRIPLALYVVMAETMGQKLRLNRAIAMSGETIIVKPELALLDAIALNKIQSVSDRLWTESTGERTPFGRLGQLPETLQEKEQTTSDITLNSQLDTLF